VRIACVFIPRFPLAVELLTRPELHGRPVILGGAPEERRQVVECSPTAERDGVRRQMSLREALVRCRDAAFLEARPSLYADTAVRMLDALEEVSPIVEGAAPGCAFVDLTGLEGVGTPDGEERLAAALQRGGKGAVGLTPRVGIADTRFAAWAAAVRPPAVATAPAARIRVVPPGEGAAFLAPLPVEHLPVSDEMRRRLRWLGLHTAGALAALPRGALAAQFGPEGAMAWDLARGEGGDPIVARRRKTEASDSLEFSRPVAEKPALLAAARHLLARLFRRPECAGRSVRGLTFDAGLSNRHRWRRLVSFRQPVADRERMLRTLGDRLEDATLPAPVESVAVKLHDLCAEAGVQGNLFSAHARRLRGLDEAVAHLHARFGRPLVMKIVGVEPWSRIPERQYALIAYEPSTTLSR
jgi:nucleotidyltransferase/DNA polymerase involved in DNA repair